MRDTILKDIIIAMKNQDKDKLSVLRMVKGSMQLEEIKVGHQLDDSEMAVLIGKEIKTRNESIEEFKKGNRQDLIDKTQKEIDILNTYMPKQMSEEEVVAEIDKAFATIKPESMRDMGKVMGMLTPVLKGKADMGHVSALIRGKLS
jgi:uncharacterized protein YqeY